MVTVAPAAAASAAVPPTVTAKLPFVVSAFVILKVSTSSALAVPVMSSAARAMVHLNRFFIVCFIIMSPFFT